MAFDINAPNMNGGKGNGQQTSKSYVTKAGNKYMVDTSSDGFQQIYLPFDMSSMGYGASVDPTKAKAMQDMQNDIVSHFTQSPDFKGNLLPNYSGTTNDPQSANRPRISGTLPYGSNAQAPVYGDTINPTQFNKQYGDPKKATVTMANQKINPNAKGIVNGNLA